MTNFSAFEGLSSNPFSPYFVDGRLMKRRKHFCVSQIVGVNAGSLKKVEVKRERATERADNLLLHGLFVHKERAFSGTHSPYHIKVKVDDVDSETDEIGGRGFGTWACFGRICSGREIHGSSSLPRHGDQMAYGRAVWQVQGTLTTFAVTVHDVSSADWMTVVVDGRNVGEFEVIDGSGSMTISIVQEAGVPHVQPGSKIVFFAEDTDRPILYGKFRSN